MFPTPSTQEELGQCWLSVIMVGFHYPLRQSRISRDHSVKNEGLSRSGCPVGLSVVDYHGCVIDVE